MAPKTGMATLSIVVAVVAAVAGVARADPEVWAVQVRRESVREAWRVAEELGMDVVGKVFEDVFLLRGDNMRQKRGDGAGRLRHPKLQWSEMQMGQRRSPRRIAVPRNAPAFGDGSGEEQGGNGQGEVKEGSREDSQREEVGKGNGEGTVQGSTGLGDAGKSGESGDKIGRRESRWGEDGGGEEGSGQEEDSGDRKEEAREGDRARKDQRNVGGLDQNRVDPRSPKSPWDVLKTKDPLRWRQWYLGGDEGMGLNVTGLWAAGVRGGGVSVAVLDDGVELTHLDLALNYDPAASWDLLDADPDPSPVTWSRHGTQLAGIVAATHNNGLCGMGMAPWTGVGAVRMLGYVVWDAVEAAALSYERDHVDVYLAAWGPVDTGAVMEGPGALAARAIRENIVLGRRGRGSVYVWASGNGGFVGDDCNADGYSNSVYTLTVSGSTRNGRAPDYAETCAATFVSTYSGDGDPEDDEDTVRGIVTTDTEGKCTESFRGSSVSAAMVAGACALALDANPDLTWRDLQHLMVLAATPHNALPHEWSTNGVGRNYSHFFGFGSLDVGKMVELGRGWRSVPPAFRCVATAPHTNLTLHPDVTLTLQLTLVGCQVALAEHVQVDADVSADNRGQLEIKVTSPAGTTSKLLPRRPLDVSPYGIHNHPFLSVHMWGEDPRGTWTLRITYHKANILEEFGKKPYVDTPNMLLRWALVVHGTEVHPARATPLHYHHNTTHAQEQHSREDRSRRTWDGDEVEDSPRVVTDHWTSPVRDDGSYHTYLQCRVSTSRPATVTAMAWQGTDGSPPRDVVKVLGWRRPGRGKAPMVLLVRESRVVGGNFTCRAVVGRVRLEGHANITTNTSTVPAITDTTRVAPVGGTATLPCRGLQPLARGVWTRNGTHITASPRIALTDDGRLTITNVQIQDAGVYECNTRAIALHYHHTARVTLLLANGTNTLLTHYAITTHPPPPVKPTPPPRCLYYEEEEEEEPPKPPPKCPRPYTLVGGMHCLAIVRGQGRSWHRARAQCQMSAGDLVKIHDPAFMLALINYIRVKGFSDMSFWVGGLRTGDEEWTWVDGSSVDTLEPYWFLEPSTSLPQAIMLPSAPFTRPSTPSTPFTPSAPFNRTSSRTGHRRTTILNLGSASPGQRLGGGGGGGGRFKNPTGRRPFRKRLRKKFRRRTRRSATTHDDVSTNDVTVPDDVRGARGELVVGAGRQRARTNHLMGLKRQRAACLWAAHGHLIASCSVMHPLHTICEYVEEEEEEEEEEDW